MVSRILPQFLDDFFPPQDVMNKVIGEFLSNQQPYPQFMATVVYKVSSLAGTFYASFTRPIRISLYNSSTLKTRNGAFLFLSSHGHLLVSRAVQASN